MYELIISSDMEDLATDLSWRLEEFLPADPLESLQLVVPNRDISRWLSQRLAQKRGIIGNLHFLLPSEWFWQEVRRHYPELPAELPSDRDALRWGLFRILSDKQDAGQGGQLAGWLEQSGRSSGSLWDLAGVIASLFDQYQVYRPGLMQQWNRGRTKTSHEEERWQAHLWNQLYEKWNKLENNLLSMDRSFFFEDILDHLANSVDERSATSRMILFNAGLLPLPLQRLFLLLSSRADIRHYSLCSFTDSVGDDLNLPEWENPLLKELASEQEVIVSMLRETAMEWGVDVTVRRTDRDIAERETASLLKDIQRSVRKNRSLPAGSVPDGSLRVKNCHSRLREVEVLYDYLLEKFEELEDLRPDEIAIVTPAPDLYRPWIDAVFLSPEEGLPRIPVHVPGGRASRGELLPAFMKWLQLSDSRLRREEVLSLLEHPPIAERLSIGAAELATLRGWFEENRVVWGLNDDHRIRFGQPAGSRQTWRAALERGWIGQLAAEVPGVMNDGRLLFSGVETADEKDLWARFSRLIRWIDEWLESVDRERTPGQWGELLHDWMEQLFRQESGESGEFADLSATVADMVRQAEWTMSDRKVPFEMVRTFLEQKFDSAGAGVAQFGEAAVFHSMVPLRGIPFRVIAILGLSDDHFPRHPAGPPFDMMKLEPVKGDRDRRREDRNLFLESVMAAGEAHFCSYLGRSRVNDESLPPSVILDRWIGLITGCCRVERSELVDETPLAGFSPRLFRQGRPESYSPSYAALADAMLRGVQEQGLQCRRPLALPEHRQGGEFELSTVESFLGNSVRYFFREQFGVRYQELKTSRQEEFELDGLEEYLIFERLLGWYLEGRPENEITELLAASGRLPEGWLSLKEVGHLLDLCRFADEELKMRNIYPGKRSEEVSFEMGDMTLRGHIYSFSEDCDLEIHPARLNGNRLVQSHFRHLVRSLEAASRGVERQTFILFLPRKGVKDAGWFRMNHDPEAGWKLEKMLRQCLEATRMPVVWPMKSALAYYESQLKSAGKTTDEADLNRAHSAAIAAGLETWRGSDYSGGSFGERQDRFYELVLGSGADLDPARLRETVDRWIAPACNQLEEC